MKKKSVSIIILSLIALIFSAEAMALGYTHNLYLCDLGIMSANSSNQIGVDFIQYTQNGKPLSVSSSSNFSTALNVATNLDPAFDRWNSDNGMNEVSINLESDYYGSQYYLEYCYTWDRAMPSDKLNYDVTFITSLPNAVALTKMSVDTKCSLKANNGAITDTQTSQNVIATNTISTDFSSMRCTIRLNFKEDSYITGRPHNGDLVGVDPNITVRVSP